MVKEEALFEYDYYSLPEVVATELQNTVEVKVQASFHSSDYSDWISARPELLLLKVTWLLYFCYQHHACAGGAAGLA